MAHEIAKRYLTDQMLQLSHYSYLICYAADRLSLEYPAAISAAIPICTRKLCRDLESLHGGHDEIELDPGVVQQRLGGLQTWLVQSLLIRLDAILHGTLDILHGRSEEADSQQIEADINAVLPRTRRDALGWAYRDAVLLAVYRNCVVHSGGALAPGRLQRLLDVGWTHDDAVARIDWQKPRFDDYLRLKKAVRSIANAWIQAAPNGGAGA